MATWIDDEGLINIRYDGHMCIHEMLHRKKGGYEESQTWLESVLPTVDVVHVEVSFFNIHMVEEHIRIMQFDYPNIKKIIVNKTSVNYKIPGYNVGFIVNPRNNDLQLKRNEFYSFNSNNNLQINPDTTIVIDDSLYKIHARSIPNHHTRLLLEEMKTLFWVKQDVDSYLRVPNTQSHVYPFWFLPLNRSNGSITWTDVVDLVHNNLSPGDFYAS